RGVEGGVCVWARLAQPARIATVSTLSHRTAVTESASPISASRLAISTPRSAAAGFQLFALEARLLDDVLPAHRFVLHVFAEFRGGLFHGHRALLRELAHEIRRIEHRIDLVVHAPDRFLRRFERRE